MRNIFRFIMATALMGSFAFAKTNNSVYRVDQSDLVANWGSILLSSSNAVSGLLGPANGGTGLSTSASTGVPSIATGTWSVNTTLPISLGGTGEAALTAHYTLIGNGTSAITLVAPGTSGQVLTSGGASADPSYQTPSGNNQPRTLVNVGLKDAASANALTITLTQSDGSTAPSAGSPVIIAYRDPTAANGAYSTVSITSGLSITIPSGATLGQTSAVNQYVWVYVLVDGGTPDLCVSGVNVFFNATLNSSTQISAGATSGTTLYCASAHTGGKPTTIIGRELVNEATAGTWASVATQKDIGVIPTRTVTENTAFPNTTIGTNANCSTNMICVNTGTTIPAYGSTTFNYASYYREGPFLYMDWYYAKTSGGTTQSTAIYMLFNVPSVSGCTIDTSQTGTAAGAQLTNAASVGEFDETSTNSGTTYIIKGQLHAWSTTSLTADYVVTESAATANTGFWNAGNFMFTSAQNPTSVTIHAKVPCVGWSQYGP